jgi:hypothetical protein
MPRGGEDRLPRPAHGPVQEGGYLSDDLGRNLVQFLSGFEKGRA